MSFMRKMVKQRSLFGKEKSESGTSFVDDLNESDSVPPDMDVEPRAATASAAVPDPSERDGTEASDRPLSVSKDKKSTKMSSLMKGVWGGSSRNLDDEPKLTPQQLKQELEDNKRLVSELREEIENLETILEESRRKEEAAQGLLNERTAYSESLEQKVKELSKTKKSLIGDLKSLEADLEDADSKLEELDAKLVESEDKVAELEATNSRLDAELAEKTQAVESLTESSKEENLTIISLREQVAVLQATVIQSQETAASLDVQESLTAELAEKTALIASQQEQIEQLKQEHEKQLGEERILNARHAETIDELNSLVEQLQGELSSRGPAVDGNLMERLLLNEDSERCKMLEEQVESYRILQKALELSVRTAEAQHIADLNDMDALKVQHENEVKELRVQCDILEARLQVGQTKESVEQAGVQVDNERLESQVHQLLAQQYDTDNLIIELKAKIQQLKTDLESSQAEAREAQIGLATSSRVADTHIDEEALQTESWQLEKIKSLNTLIITGEQALAQAQAKHAEEVEALNFKIFGLKSEINSLKDAASMQAQALEALERERDDLLTSAVERSFEASSTVTSAELAKGNALAREEEVKMLVDLCHELTMELDYVKSPPPSSRRGPSSKQFGGEGEDRSRNGLDSLFSQPLVTVDQGLPPSPLFRQSSPGFPLQSPRRSQSPTKPEPRQQGRSVSAGRARSLDPSFFGPGSGSLSEEDYRQPRHTSSYAASSSSSSSANPMSVSLPDNPTRNLLRGAVMSMLNRSRTEAETVDQRLHSPPSRPSRATPTPRTSTVPLLGQEPIYNNTRPVYPQSAFPSTTSPSPASLTGPSPPSSPSRRQPRPDYSAVQSSGYGQRQPQQQQQRKGSQSQASSDVGTVSSEGGRGRREEPAVGNATHANQETRLALLRMIHSN